MKRLRGIVKRILGILKRLARPRLWQSENDLKKLYQSCFSGPAGETVLLDLAEKFNLGLPIKGDEFMEGERNVVLYIVKMLYEPIPIEDASDGTGRKDSPA